MFKKQLKLLKQFSSLNKKESEILGQKLHASQFQTLTQNLILVNRHDEVTGNIDKLTAHRNDYIFSEKGEPHRAFSVFLFNHQNELLLHKRSDIKITFPKFWTNTCCSHPLMQADEMNQEEGCRLAAKRRLNFELNIEIENQHDFLLVDKFIYKAPSYEGWGEYELDYVFLIKRDIKEVNPNPEEISEFAWVKKDQLKSFLKEKLESKGEKATPWFEKIIEHKLMNWWELMEKDQVQPITDIEKVNKNIPLL